MKWEFFLFFLTMADWMHILVISLLILTIFDNNISSMQNGGPGTAIFLKKKPAYKP